jgi:uncharacterized protein (TIGR02996 family)
MNLAETFLQKIRENPDDDSIRLIFADWLEERGGPASTARAEFIRLQCAMAGMDQDARHGELQAREHALLHEHEQEWLGLPHDALHPCNCQFRRGFLESVYIDAEKFLTHAETLFRLHPLRHVALGHRAEGHLAALAASPYLARLASLEMSGYDTPHGGQDVFVQPGDATLFFNSPYLSRLSRLQVRQFRQGAEVARALAQSPSLTGLTALDLEEGNVGDEGATTLAGLPNLSKLQVLHLIYLRIGTAGAMALAAPPFLASLNELWIFCCRIEGNGMQALQERFGDRVHP